MPLYIVRAALNSGPLAHPVVRVVLYHSDEDNFTKRHRVAATGIGLSGGVRRVLEALGWAPRSLPDKVAPLEKIAFDNSLLIEANHVYSTDLVVR
jgi:hypothetical protein